MAVCFLTGIMRLGALSRTICRGDRINYAQFYYLLQWPPPIIKILLQNVIHILWWGPVLYGVDTSSSMSRRSGKTCCVKLSVYGVLPAK